MSCISPIIKDETVADPYLWHPHKRVGSTGPAFGQQPNRHWQNELLHPQPWLWSAAVPIVLCYSH